MYIPNYPEDSTLRRHYESAAEFRRQARLARPPTDSVLRRHYDQLHGMTAMPGRPAAPTPRAPTPAAHARPVIASAPPPPPPQQPVASGGGLFGWLKRLFG